MKFVILAIIFIIPTTGHCADANYKDILGKKYWVTGKIFFLKSGACGERNPIEYKPKPGTSFQITGVKERIPYRDNSGYWNGLDIQFDNGDITCMDKRFFNSTAYSISETNPADEYLGKRFWVKSNLWMTKGYYKGECGDEYAKDKLRYLENEDAFEPKIKQTFIVQKYFPVTSSYESRLEVVFDDNKVACAKIFEIRNNITITNPENNEKLLMEKLKAAGINEGKNVWLKYPVNDMPGLTKVIIEKIEYAFDTTSFTFDSEDYESYTQKLTLDELLDRVYIKLPKIFSKLSRRVATAIENEKVIIGMTTSEALASWGKPSDINRTAGSWGTHEQWVYGNKTYLYFKNGKLTSWQN